jgi:predicted DNA-binding transcriptional regulator AlpA
VPNLKHRRAERHGSSEPSVNQQTASPSRPETVRQSTPTMERVSVASRLLTAEDVAEVTRLSVETLAQWRSQGRGVPYIKVGRNCVRYRQCDLDGWLAERIVRTHQDSSDRR